MYGAMTSLRALVLDLGEVLVRSQPPELVQLMADVAAVPLPAFQGAYWAHRKEFDLASDPAGYWEDVLRDARSPLGAAARAAARLRLGALDAESWTQYREEVWELALRFKEGGGRTALLSNCGPEVIDRVKAQRPVARYFDAMVVSWEVRVAKPDAAIYRIALERLGVAPGEALFVDDRAENVAGAEAVGMRGMMFEGDGAVERLRRLVEDRVAR
jgi:putative hydrolase of the HAD superfamily